MCTKKTFSIFEKFILFSTHYIYEKKSISRWHHGNYSYRLMREKNQMGRLAQFSSIAQVIVDP